MISARHKLLFFYVLLFITPLSHAVTDHCGYKANREYLSLQHKRQGDAVLDAIAGASIDSRVSSLGMNWHIIDNKRNTDVYQVSIGTQLEYSKLGFDGVTPMTNGHLHTWRFPFRLTKQNRSSALELRLMPAISASSNVMKEPAFYSQNVFQLSSGMNYSLYNNDRSTWVLGFISDYRLGNYQLYPVMGICWQPSTDWRIQLTWPDINITKSYSATISVTGFVEPVGNNWHTYSRDKTQHTDLVYDGLTMGVVVERRFASSVALQLSVERVSQRNYVFALQDDTRISTRAGSTTEVGLNVEWFF